MFIFKKLLTPFLIPPGAFITLLFAGGLWNMRKSRAGRSYGYFFAAGVMWLALIQPVGDAALSRIEYAFLPPSDLKADVIISLCGGATEDSPGGAVGPALTGIELERASEAARLYRRYRLPVIVSGGPVFSAPVNSRIVKEYLVSLGVPADRIITEERSRDTLENAAFSKKICDGKGHKRAVLVTSAFHMKRAVWTFQRAGFRELVPYPTGYKSSKIRRYSFFDYLPGSGENLAIAAHEYLGLIFYKLTAARGG